MASHVEGEAFFVWQSEPTVIYGRNQVLENEVNMTYCQEYEVEVVRRKSGGGCVYSDKGNIMISYKIKKSPRTNIIRGDSKPY